MDLAIHNALDSRRLEVVADGLTLWRGSSTRQRHNDGVTFAPGRDHQTQVSRGDGAIPHRSGESSSPGGAVGPARPGRDSLGETVERHFGVHCSPCFCHVRSWTGALSLAQTRWSPQSVRSRGSRASFEHSVRLDRCMSGGSFNFVGKKKKLLRELEGHPSRAQCVREAQHTVAVLAEVPEWSKFSDPHFRAPQPVDPEVGEWTHGWQFHASVARDTLFATSVHLPPLSTNHQA